ncbi:adenylyl-sulfate kinase [Nocardioides houyundeii]|uniref:adenylyl-sulfate kinase n=1 Tax=Nocardioides houyundeii TaxID=2045452 RepID=UPI001F53DFAC|nr:adenylyl-sulfate kinase [Nocardioides houyundeii]
MSASSLPQHCPTPVELDDLELLLSGALAPLTGFNEPGSAVTLALPEALKDLDAVELVDPEGLPLAIASQGAVTPLSHPQFGPFRNLYLTPAQVRQQYAGRTFVPVTDALTVGQLEELADLGPLVLLALAGTGTPTLSPVGLIRATIAAAGLLPDAAVVVVPLAAHGDAVADHDLGVQVVGNYAQGDPVTGLTSVSDDDPLADYPEEIADIVDFDRPGPGQQGLVLFFTGLSGSGKSTLARALMDKVLEQGERTVTSLDGDVVRRNLSAGLTFSKADRETNIRRIGWVAAEIARHGGVAIVSPIAPFDETRQQVREMVEQAGGEFFLVHVATPLEECERRDRKGLYAKARRGEIPEFTGISSPYEEPTDAAVRVDTTGRSIEDALDDVLVALAKTGHLDLRETDREPLKVLFVCTANICRSAFMEVTARHLAGDRTDIEFSSAGTHGFKDHALDGEMAAVLAPAVEHDDFASRPVTRDLIDDADLVLTAESTHRTYLLEEHPQAFRKVFTLGQFAEVAGGSDLHGRDLIESLGRQRGAARPEHDIADPYRRGPQASAEAGQRITALLETVIPALTGETR